MATVPAHSQTRLTHFGMGNPCSIVFFSQNWSWKDEKRIMEETGCHNDGLIHTYLSVGLPQSRQLRDAAVQECDGNVNEVIERVIAWMTENDCLTEKAAFLAEDENNPLAFDCSASEEDTTSETCIPSPDTEEEFPSGSAFACTCVKLPDSQAGTKYCVKIR